MNVNRVVQFARCSGLCAGLALAFNVRAQTNSWTDTTGKWEIGANWSAGTPANSNAANLITNATTKVVTIDATTALSNAINGCMTISNFVVSRAVPPENTLQITNVGVATPLRILNSVTIGGGGALVVTNSALQVDVATSIGVTGAGTLSLLSGTATIASNMVLGVNAGATGTVWVAGGTVNLTNFASTTVLGNAGDGQIILSNGTFLTRNLFVGSNTFSHGTLTVLGGSLVTSNANFAVASNSTAAIWLSGGELIATNRGVIFGNFGTVQMTVSNGATLRAFGSFLPLRPSGRGTLTIAGGTASFISLSVGAGSNSFGSIWMNDGLLVTTNGGLGLGGGTASFCAMTMSNGTSLTRDFQMTLGNSSVATFTMWGGTMSLSSALTSNCVVGFGNGSKGSVWINGGQFIATNNGCTMFLGINGSGQWTMTNGSVSTAELLLGTLQPAAGTLSIAGGSFSVANNVTMALDINTTGTVLVSGGQFTVPNGTVVVGNAGIASVVVSGGMMVARSMIVSSNSVATGSLTIPSGQATIFDRLVLGDCVSNAVGRVTVNGGNLFVTNATGTAVLDVRDGTLTLSAGTLRVDKLVITNTCGHFVHSGGNLSITSTNLDPNLDADSDGIPNGYEQAHGLDPLNPADANLDSDGDGFTNLQEFQTGTDPTNSASALRITAIAREGIDIRVTWMTGPDKTNALERTAGAAGSFATNNFAAIFTVTNTVGTVTNYLDLGAATNVPAFYYRVRLVP